MRIRITIEADLHTDKMDEYRSYRERLAPHGVDAVKGWLTGANWRTGEGGSLEKVFRSMEIRSDFLLATAIDVVEVPDVTGAQTEVPSDRS